MGVEKLCSGYSRAGSVSLFASLHFRSSTSCLSLAIVVRSPLRDVVSASPSEVNAAAYQKRLLSKCMMGVREYAEGDLPSRRWHSSKQVWLCTIPSRTDTAHDLPDAQSLQRYSAVLLYVPYHLNARAISSNDVTSRSCSCTIACAWPHEEGSPYSSCGFSHTTK